MESTLQGRNQFVALGVTGSIALLHCYQMYYFLPGNAIVTEGLINIAQGHYEKHTSCAAVHNQHENDHSILPLYSSPKLRSQSCNRRSIM